MYLLNVHELKLEWFNNDDKRPPYAILSHTWGDEEVSMQDLRTLSAKSMAGYSKIVKCCEIAIQDGFDYVWIDTCCIDKTSSAELSEAINSMYHWYQSAKVCYAYLSDVHGRGDENNPGSSFTKSRWFTRGWTLQELLAPDIVMFYNSDWVSIGTRRSLQVGITIITGIPGKALLKEVGTETFSIATRMSWAANRQTTRVEDVAYCLLGVFGVNMPPLYGEGMNAFTRLQGEIMKGSDDQSLFAWMLSSGRALKVGDGIQDGIKGDWEGEILTKLWCPDQYDSREVGLLAPSPHAFKHMKDVDRLPGGQQSRTTKPFLITNVGLHIWMPLVRVSAAKYEIFQAMLNCDISDGNGCLTIFLRRHPSGHYSRILSTAICATELGKFNNKEPVEMYIRGAVLSKTNNSTFWSNLNFWRSYRLRFNANDSHQTGYTVQSALDPEFAHKREILFVSASSRSWNMHMSYFIVHAKSNTSVRALVAIGVSFGSQKLYCAVHPEGEDSIRRICASSSKAPPVTGFTQQPGYLVEYPNMKIIFPDADPVIPGESIIKDLSDGLAISITLRASPNFPPTLNSSPVSCAMIEFIPSRLEIMQRETSVASGSGSGRLGADDGQNAKARRDRRPEHITYTAVA